MLRQYYLLELRFLFDYVDRTGIFLTDDVVSIVCFDLHFLSNLQLINIFLEFTIFAALLYAYSIVQPHNRLGCHNLNGEFFKFTEELCVPDALWRQQENSLFFHASLDLLFSVLNKEPQSSTAQVDRIESFNDVVNWYSHSLLPFCNTNYKLQIGRFVIDCEQLLVFDVRIHGEGFSELRQLVIRLTIFLNVFQILTQKIVLWVKEGAFFDITWLNFCAHVSQCYFDRRYIKWALQYPET